VNMNWFQILALTVFVLLSLLTVGSAMRGGLRTRVAVFWLLIWATGAVTMIWPSTLILLAHNLGIGRGADLLLYLSVLTMLAGFFYAYARFRKLDRQMTQLVRRLALEHPKLPEAEPKER
jgi:small membrane protein